MHSSLFVVSYVTISFQQVSELERSLSACREKLAVGEGRLTKCLALNKRLLLEKVSADMVMVEIILISAG